MPDSSEIKIPRPLTSEEIKDGIADRLRNEIRASLDKTCSLNSVEFPSFSAKWNIEYDLNDFGRHTVANIGGSLNPENLTETAVKLVGVIDEMPPDRFRRETGQKIPDPQIVHARNEDPQQGVYRAHRGRPKKVSDV